MQLLSARTADSFESQIRARGKKYFEEERVLVQFVNDDSMSLVVWGGKDGYDVEVHWFAAQEKILLVSCSCPYFQAASQPCKHLWAAILCLDASGKTVQISGTGPLHLVDLSSFEWDDLWDADRADAMEPASMWRTSLDFVRQNVPTAGPPTTVPRRRAWFVLEGNELFFNEDGLQISFYRQDPLRSGGYGKLKSSHIGSTEAALFEPEDCELLLFLLSLQGMNWNSGFDEYRDASLLLPQPLFEAVLPRLCASQRFGWLSEDDSGRQCVPLQTDFEPLWQLRLVGEDAAAEVRLKGQLVRRRTTEMDDAAEETDHGLEEVDLSEPLLLFPNGWIFFSDRIGRFAQNELHFPWISLLRRDATIDIPREDVPQALEEMGLIPGLPQMEMPPSLDWPVTTLVPEPCMTFRFESSAVMAEPCFVYGQRRVGCFETISGWPAFDLQRLVRRDLAAEGEMLRSIEDLDLAEAFDPEGLGLDHQTFVASATALLDRGWRVEAEGRKLRSSSGFSAKVSSGIDWFGLSGSMSFEGQNVSLPALLEATRQGRRMVLLDDGSMGLLPEEWVERFTPLAQVAPDGADTRAGDGDADLRFPSHQGLLLDSLLAATPDLEVDERFERLRQQLRRFDGLDPVEAPETFCGELRPYQEQGLAWLYWLAEVGLGGCLADDMGLGKTIQVLALLEQRRLQHEQVSGEGAPSLSLLVVPRSLLHNWILESERFTPKLVVRLYHGADRKTIIDEISTAGTPTVLVTTYGTMRRDIATLLGIDFDLVVLDEAQAVKNGSSQTAKACRLLGARMRLALTGTPVENHLGELWSIFEFLNPGMLGRLPALSSMAGKSKLPAESLTVLGRAIRPLVLRRTKAQVLPDLPSKTEQTLHCELSTRERKRYDDLLSHYRSRLTEKVQEVGLGRSKIHVFEALLRLRQAACHGGLLDPALNGETSAKLEVLLERLREVVAEGGKALVFSQFTRFLSIVRHRLEGEGLVYEYLDGRTRNRQKKVDRFQDDAQCSLFLISLKAGGVGLNLTAASYVFLLDPWWNPAVEAQAIDRAHRIGQQRPVFAYRLIARNTVEEKIVQLQDSKRALADAIVAQDNRLLGQLTAEDLALLLGGPLDVESSIPG